MPAVILVVAGAFAWWGSQREVARISAIDQAVTMVLQGGSPAAAGIGMMPPNLDTVLEQLRSELEQTRAQPSVAIRPGDEAGYGNGDATHTAIIEADGVPRLGLRVVYDDERAGTPFAIRIIGYWVPP